jgi:hypothetical protein
MVAPVKKPSAVILLRPRNSNVVLAPCKLGWANLIEPDDKYGKPRFNAKFHFSDAVYARNLSLIEEAVEALMPEFVKECAAFKDLKTGKPRPYELPTDKIDVEAWMQNKIKEPGENSPIKDPTFLISLKHRKGVSKKDGSSWEVRPRAWSGSNELLNLRTLKMGSGSVVQPVVNIGLFVAPNQPDPAIALELVGVRVLKLVQYQGGQGPKLDKMTDEDLAMLGDDEDIDDLSSFLGNSLTTPEAAPEGASGSAAEEGDEPPL